MSTVYDVTAAMTAARAPTNEYLMEGLRRRSIYQPVVGEIFFQYDYFGLLPNPAGCMLCNGDVINETNYDAIHGAGKWAEEVVTSLLNGKYTPNIEDTYLSYKSTVSTQSGNTPITKEGNAANTTSLAHTHTVNSHNHQIYETRGTNTSDRIYNSAGNAITLSSSVGQTTKSVVTSAWIFNSIRSLVTGSSNYLTLPNTYTSGKSLSSNTAAPTTLNVQPETLYAKAWVRIV